MVYSLPMCKYVTRVPQISNTKTICFLKEREDNLIFALLATAAPEVRVGEAEGVVEADDGVQLDGERLKVGLGLLDLDRGAGGRRGDERRGDGEARESDGKLLRWGLTMSFPAARDIGMRCVMYGCDVCGRTAGNSCSGGRGGRLFFWTTSDDRLRACQWPHFCKNAARQSCAKPRNMPKPARRPDAPPRAVRASLEIGSLDLGCDPGRAPVQARGRAASL